MRRLWYHGKVTSMDGQMRHYEALGTEDGKIVFLGTDEEAGNQAWDERTDLEGKLLLPGFSDTHMHMLYYGMFRVQLPLFGVDSIETVVALGQERIAQQHPDYLIGMGWNQETMREGRMVERADMDRISTEVPICMLRTCGHIAACNTKMLELIQALPDLSPTVRGLIDFERGLLREDAMRLYMEVIPPMDDAFVRELVRIAQADLNAAGITCVHTDDLCTIPGMDPVHLVQLFREMEAEGALSVRIYEQWQGAGENFGRLLAVGPDLSDRESLFRMGPRKLLQDGSLGAKSAEMEGGYVDDPDNHGIPIYAQEELNRLVREAHDAHVNVAVHAIGDLALRNVLDAIELAQRENPWPEHRHGIVHAQTTSPALLARMKDMGVQAYVQPIFIEADMRIIEERVGPQKARECYCWKTMDEMGIHISGGSDCPVEPFDVLDNIRSAVTRKSRDGKRTYLPEQAMSVEEAVALFTSKAAWPCGDEGVRGTLELGRQADLVVLEQDLFTISPDDFPKVKVMETVLGGRTVYRR